MSNLVISLNLVGLVISQYTGFNFTSLCIFGESQLGANDDGIFALDGETDDGAMIPALFTMPTSDYGSSVQKHFRALFLNAFASGKLAVIMRTDDETERRYEVTTIKGGTLLHSLKVPVGRDLRGRNFTIQVENVDGGNFGLNRIEGLVIPLTRKPPGA